MVVFCTPKMLFGLSFISQLAFNSPRCSINQSDLSNRKEHEHEPTQNRLMASQVKHTIIGSAFHKNSCLYIKNKIS